MSDKYVLLANFKWGLDSRRSELTTQPGALVQCENAHINSGGEVEQRKAFVKEPGTFSANTFGIEVTDAGLVTFGSDASGSVTLPSGVTYQRLVHPTGFSAVGVVATMTDVFSCNFNGKAFAIATFDDGNKFLYYNATLILESRTGLVMYVAATAETTTDLATQFAAEINDRLSGWIAVASTNRVAITAPAGESFALTIAKSSASGAIVNGVVSTGSDGTSAKQAYAQFKISVAGTNGVDSWVLSAFYDAAGTTAANLSGTVLAAATIILTGQAIVAAVNAGYAAHGYTALFNGTDVVFVYSPTLFGAVTFNLTITTTGTAVADTTITTTPTLAVNWYGAAYGFGTGSDVFGRMIHTGDPGGSGNPYGLKVTSSGGVFPHSYEWVECNADGSTPVTKATGIGIESPNSSLTRLYKYLSAGTKVTGYFVCKVTDSSTPNAQVKTIATPGTAALECTKRN